MRRPEPLPQRPRVEPAVEPVFDASDVVEEFEEFDECVDEPVTFGDDSSRDTGDVTEWNHGAEAEEPVTADDEETAVITPFHRPEKRTADEAADAEPGSSAFDTADSDDARDATDADDATDSSEETPQPAVGWRDVWRAARAKRKALRREVRRFTGRARRRRLIWIVSLSSLAAVIVGSFAIAYSPLFAVQKITVTGTTSLDPAVVTESLSGQMGTPLALVSESEIKAVLVTFPAVETYTVQARPPHELIVTIVERTPVGVVETDAGYSLVDAAGVVLSTTPDAPVGYPLFQVAGGLGESTFRSAGMVMLSIPDSIRGSVSKVTATTPADVTLTLTPTGTQIIWGNADDSQIKSQVLEKAMLTRPIDTVSVYDVSSPTAIVMR